MNFNKALAIVMDLTSDNVLDDFAVSADPETLKPIQEEQIEAIEVVQAQIDYMYLTGMLEE